MKSEEKKMAPPGRGTKTNEKTDALHPNETAHLEQSNMQGAEIYRGDYS
jgi:hypothetical protein